MKGCLILHVIREIHIKTTMRYHLTIVRMTIMKKSTVNKCWKGDGKKRNPPILYVGRQICQSLWRRVWSFLKKKKKTKNGLTVWSCNPALGHVLSCFSCVQLFVTLWTVACHVFLSMGFFRQQYWSGLSCPPPGDLPNPGIKPASLCLLHWQAGYLPLMPPEKPTLRYISRENSNLRYLNLHVHSSTIYNSQDMKAT